MACPQCGDEVDCIGIQGGAIVHRCPVCGTQVTGSGLTNNLCIEVPQLIAKLRAFEEYLSDFQRSVWADLGIRRVVGLEGRR